MKTLNALIILSILSFAGCSEHKTKTIGKKSSNSCECEKTIKQDTLFFATDIRTEIHNNEKYLKFNCASVETAIASVTNESGDEMCENLNEIKCISETEHKLKLSKDFSYFSPEMKNMEARDGKAQNLFFEESKNENLYFKFNLDNKREIKEILKIDIQ